MYGGSQTSTTSTQLIGGGFQDSMIPSHAPPPTSKRKGAQEGNPLEQAVKKAKKESSGKSASAKRKLLGEQQPGGLVIVRASSARPPLSQDSRPAQVEPFQRHSSVPPTPTSRSYSIGDIPNGSHADHPSKKFRADGEPMVNDVGGKGKGRAVLPGVAEVDEEVRQSEDVRRMQSETDNLRRKSRAAEAVTANANPAFQFPPSGASSKSSQSQPSRGRIREMSIPLPLQETPQIQRNKHLRGDTGHRRQSSLSRGKRISSSYENTGVIGASSLVRPGFPVIRPAHKDLAQPHTSVRDTSFYKHIDVELPEPQRAQQLLIWCSHRAMSEMTEQNGHALATSQRNSKNAGKDPPGLSEEDMRLLKGVEEDLVRMLAERKVDTNVYSHPGDDEAPRQLKENEQNVRNRAREVKFNAHIQTLKQEDEAWVEVGSSYNSFRSAVLTELDERKKEFPSAKAKGKRPATAEDIALWDISEKDLPEHFRSRDGLSMARSLMDGTASRKSAVGKRMEELELTADRLHSLAHCTLEATRLAESDLDRRFSLLNIFLTSRIQPLLPSSNSSSALSSYLPPSISRPPPTTDPQALLRAMSRVDAGRPQTQVGDAARRAAREVQRAHDASGGVPAERRLTVAPPPTPRKPPGTPRRATTPGRGR